MKKISLVFVAIIIASCSANADPFAGGMGITPEAINVMRDAQMNTQRSFYDVQQLQSKSESRKGSLNEFRDFKQQQKENQERVKRDIERQQRIQERVQQTTPKSQFVNDNGVIRIENSF